MIYRVIIFFSVIFIFNYSFAIDNNIQKFLLNEIKNELKKENAFSIAQKDKDIKIKATLANRKDLPDKENQFASVSIDSINRRNGYFRAIIKYYSSNFNLLSTAVNGTFEEFIDIPVLKTRTNPKYVIKEDDLTKIKIKSRELTNDIAKKIIDLVGMTPTRTLWANVAISKKYLKTPTLVDKKNIVTMLYDKGQVSIKATGESLESGSMGDTIRVRNRKSKMVVQGIVIGRNQVRIQSR